MIRISRKADYGIFIMTHLAQQAGVDGAGPMSAQELAGHIQLSKAVVANLLKDLAKAGLLSSVRGVHGGYSLARPDGEISLLSILEAVDGPFSLVECAHDRPQEEDSETCGCSLSSICPSRGPLQVLHDRIVDLMKHLSLEEIGDPRNSFVLSSVGAAPNFLLASESKSTRKSSRNSPQNSPQTPPRMPPENPPGAEDQR